MKKIPIFINHFGIKNVELCEMLNKKQKEKAKDKTFKESEVFNKCDPNNKKAKFTDYQLILLAEIEKEFLNSYREKLVKYKHLKFIENDRNNNT